jgi:hypothetical protein
MTPQAAAFEIVWTEAISQPSGYFLQTESSQSFYYFKK